MIKIENLSYSYPVFEKEAGFLGTIKDLFNRKTEWVEGVSNVDLEIKEGEFVGLLGPNGAGKTTLIKLMTGILTPSKGKVTCDGHTPHLRTKEYLSDIGVVLGQKSQLVWDLPANESFRLLASIYELDEASAKERVNMMAELLNVTHKLDVPVRKLSLGERMKFELICALLHKPKILFLDEPTIGLDIVSQVAIHDFLKEINKRDNTTIILTSHYMKDIQALCERIVIIMKGSIYADKPINEFTVPEVDEDLVVISLVDGYPVDLSEEYELNEDGQVSLPKEELETFLQSVPIEAIDQIHTESVQLEDVIYDLFSQEA